METHNEYKHIFKAFLSFLIESKQNLSFSLLGGQEKQFDDATLGSRKL